MQQHGVKHRILDQLLLLGLEQLLRHALRAGLCAEAEVPQLLAELSRVLVEEAGEGDLYGLDVGL